MKIEIIFILLILALSISCKSIAQDSYVEPETSSIAILKTELRCLNLQKPEKDLDLNYKNKDFRFICICGFACYAPGIDSSGQKIAKKWGLRCLRGTSDVIESDEHARLMGLAKEYAEKYNSLLLKKLKENP